MFKKCTYSFYTSCPRLGFISSKLRLSRSSGEIAHRSIFGLTSAPRLRVAEPFGAWKPMACNPCHSESDPSFATAFILSTRMPSVRSNWHRSVRCSFMIRVEATPRLLARPVLLVTPGGETPAAAPVRVSIPKTRLSQEKDPAAGPDAPGSATCVSSSCHRGVFTCPNQKTAGFGVWLFAERQGFTPMDGNSESSEGNASSSGSPLVTVIEASDFQNLDHGSEFRRLNRSRFRRVLTQCQMCARLQIVVEIRPESPS